MPASPGGGAGSLVMPPAGPCWTDLSLGSMTTGAPGICGKVWSYCPSSLEGEAHSRDPLVLSDHGGCTLSSFRVTAGTYALPADTWALEAGSGPREHGLGCEGRGAWMRQGLKGRLKAPGGAVPSWVRGVRADVLPRTCLLDAVMGTPTARQHSCGHVGSAAQKPRVSYWSL